MWTVLYIAPGQSEANRLKELMETEGIMVRLRPVGMMINEKTSNIEILVPETELEEAQEVLTHGLQR
ncbi:MAG TPA: DUF2007 domain-containing protein [Firmicutes bacterium]|nr:DUF2007 domain-containing protein [Bacillota bacterium]HOQ24560.1 DUF2007 domain-containing protein [Bacillota bacterium]HPT67783.1 DUF2007 domain-containing protein [Bacillota bacterium]